MLADMASLPMAVLKLPLIVVFPPKPSDALPLEKEP